MAIQFARIEYVKRSGGGNVCRKAAYNMRDQVEDQKTGEVFSFKNRGGCVYHEVLLPDGAKERFKDSETLWNAADAAEKRGNSQLAKEMVLALPDNPEVTLDDKIELIKRFSQINFVDKGVAVQFDIHSPHHTEDKNWHAHLLITTRRFTEDGNSFSKVKARDLDAQVRKFKVVEAEEWGKNWRDIQNNYFIEKGLNIRVDEIGAIAQEHLGPVRMRNHMNEVNERAKVLKEANQVASADPTAVLNHLSKVHAAFTEKHLDSYLNKHVVGELHGEVKEGVLEHADLVRLYNKQTGDKVGFYTTKQVRAEEERVLREADRINLSGKIQAAPSAAREIVNSRSFSQEQLGVFEYCVRGDQGIKVVEGRAGTGKSYVIQGVREAYERSGGTVIGLSKDNKVKNDMVEKGFSSAYTVKKLMFLHNNNRIHIKHGSLFMVDEAALLDTPAYNELFKVVRTHSAKVILVGDDRQQTSIERGGMFSVLAERYGSQELKKVRRQRVDWQKNVSEYLSDSNFDKALGLMEHNQRLHWSATKEDSFSALVEQWCKDKLDKPEQTQLILTHRNVDVDVINQAIQRVQQSLGKVSTKEFVCETNRGDVGFAVGDRVMLSATDKELGLFNGELGTLSAATTDKFVILQDNGKEVSFDPGSYKGLRLAYATTIYKGQGATVDTAYVLHSPTTNEKQNYVALTRQVSDVHLYVTSNETKDLKRLAIQMGKEDDKISSLEFHTEDEISKLQRMEGSNLHKALYTFEDKIKGIIHTVTDRLHHNAEFYNYSPEKVETPSSVKERDATERWQQETSQSPSNDDAATNVVNNKTTFVANDSGIQSKEGKAKSPKESIKDSGRGIDAVVVEDALKKDIRGFAVHLLGEPDKKLSSARELCFRKDGKVFVNLETGLWKDFVNDTGGNLFGLIPREHGGEFKDALAYGTSYAGLSDKAPKDIAKNENSIAKLANTKVGDLKAADAEKADKVKRVESLYDRSIPAAGTLGERYLREHRGIQGELDGDLRFSDKVYNSELKKEIPALLAFGRDREGNIKACQAIYLDKSTGNKADVSPSKKTFGMLSGSFVEIQKGQGATHVAEGVETALSVKEAGVSGNIFASLGVQNIKHFDRKAENLIICADNDGQNAPSRTVIEKSRDILQEKGYTTAIIEPNQTGEDFNDVLKKEGKTGVAQYFGHEHRAQQKVHVRRSHAEEIQKEEPATKANAEVNANLTHSQKLDALTKKFRSKLEGMYREKVGADYKSYKDEITVVAQRAAKDALVLSISSEESNSRILLARNQYELWRSKEIKENLISKDTNFVDNWMKHAFKAESIASIEGRMFGEIRAQKEKLTTTELKDISKHAAKEYEGNVGKLQAYIKEATKEMGGNPQMAKMYAEQRILFEERYGMKPSSEQLKGIKEAVEYGHTQYKTYQQEFTDKIKNAHGSVNEATSNYIDQAARYKAHLEIKEVIPNAIANDANKMPTAKELKVIGTNVEKSFRADKQHYEQLHEQQKQVQQTAEKNKSRGFER